MRQPAALALIVVLLAGSRAARGQAEEKPAGQRAYTLNEYRQDMLEFNRRTLAGAYKETGSHGPWDDGAVAFLERFAVYITYSPRGTLRPPTMPKPEELLAEGRAVLAAGCDDPLVRYCVVVLLEAAGRVAEGVAMLPDVVTALDGSPYPHHRVWAAARRLGRLAPDTQAGREAARIAEARLGQLPYVTGIGDFERRDWLNNIWEHLVQLRARPLQAQYVERLRLSGKADPWIVDVLEGRMLIKRAWDARGYGYANTVTDDGWAKFHKDLAAARDVLTRAWKLRPNLPEAPTEMITVSMGAGGKLGEDERAWFDRATAAELDWEPAYDAIFEARMPRWGGSHEEVLRIGLDAADTKRYDTALPWQLGRAVAVVAADVPGGWAEVLKRPGLYERLVDVANGYVAFLEPRRGDALETYRSMPAALAWRTGRYEDARRALEALGGRVDPTPFLTVGAKGGAAAIGSAWVRGGPAGERAKQAEDAMSAGDAEAALAQFRALAAELAREPLAKPYLDVRIDALDRRVRFAAGEWVDLQPVGGLSGWTPTVGAWELRPDGSLAGNFTAGLQHQYIYCDEDFGDRFEISVRLEELSPQLVPCITFTRAPGKEPGTDILVLRNEVRLLDPREPTPLRVVAARAPIQAPVEFVVRCKAGRVDVKVNDQEWADQPLASSRGRGLRVGVGAQGRGTVRFTGLKIRKLPEDDADGPKP